MPYAETKNPIAKKQFLQTIGFQMRCGVPIVTAIDASGKDFPIYRRDANEMMHNVQYGEPFSDYFYGKGLEEFLIIEPFNCGKLAKQIIDAEEIGELSQVLYSDAPNVMREAIRTKFPELKSMTRKKIEQDERWLFSKLEAQEMIQQIRKVQGMFEKSPLVMERGRGEVFSERIKDYFEQEIVPDFQDYQYFKIYS